MGSAVELALKTGYRLVDCAFVYLNEAEVGETLQKCFKNGVARREDIFITSKLWYYSTHKINTIRPCKYHQSSLEFNMAAIYSTPK